jgi:hypothetical protein
MRRTALAAAWLCIVAETMRAQQPNDPPQPRAVTRTIYIQNTELFAEWRPLIVGQTTRLTAHLTHTGDRFRPYVEGKVTLTLTVEGVTANAVADGPERPGVFRLNVTPTKSGAGRVVIDVPGTTGPQHFVIADVPVYEDVKASLSKEVPAETGLISYAKERSWEEDFATAPAKAYFQGAARIVLVPSAAVIREGDTAHVYVRRTPERFEWREVKTRRTIGNSVEIAGGLSDGERIVIRGDDKCRASRDRVDCH